MCEAVSEVVLHFEQRESLKEKTPASIPLHERLKMHGVRRFSREGKLSAPVSTTPKYAPVIGIPGHPA